jgi:hypothetical protein
MKMPSDAQFRLHMGELTEDELRIARAAFRLGVTLSRAAITSSGAVLWRQCVDVLEVEE